MKEKRQRANSFVVRVTDEELKLIEQKMVKSHISNRNAYIRKMAIDGYIINVELSDIIEAVRLLRNISNNVNQIAKHANETGAIYQSDLEDIKQGYEDLIEPLRDALQKINMITNI